MRYACFPQTRRLAIDVAGSVTVYDTGEHLITGFSQQQSGDASLTFTSQHGLIRVADLAIVFPVRVAAPAHAPETVFRPTPLPASADVAPASAAARPVSALPQAASRVPSSHDEIIAAIERLAGLKDKGILSEAEFAAKKAELLARL
jgi:hypothetical protein